MSDPIADALAALTRPGMGTENAGPALRALATMSRPRTVLEVGAGSSTLHLLLGLADARAEAARDRRIIGGQSPEPERASVLRPRAALADYAPKLLVVDDISVPGTSADQVLQAARALGLDDMLTFIERDFFDLTDEELDSWGPLDLVWLDAGTQADDAAFLTSLWPRVPLGGTVVLHEPYIATTVETRDPQGRTRVAGRIVPTPLLQELRRQAAAGGGGMDVLALDEPHKHRQTGLLLIRRREAWEGDRGTSFSEELAALGETDSAEPPLLDPPAEPAGPARPAGSAGPATPTDPTTPAGAVPEQPAAREAEDPARALVAALADETRRRVYSAVVLLPDTAQGVAERLALAPARVAKALAALEQSGLVTRTGDGWSAVDDVWREASPRRERPPAPVVIPAKRGKRLVFLKELVRLFEPDRRYPERSVNDLLREVHPDVAALRRYLVEERLLARADGQYWRL
ncbi:DUF2087 domain-containing protein [Streptomyces sp. NPDC048718]|uniref:DUF2087 domain-containing protein n=1 Tax=Streptomyces sp. NPDC048718 TaxID=3365587 RepID=UPI003717BB08